MKSRLQIGAILRRYGIISEAELDLALSYQREHRVRLGEALLALGYCTEAHLARALADQLGMPFVDLEQTPPSREALRTIPRTLAQKLSAVPVEKRDGRLIVVAKNPLDYSIDASLRQVAGMPVTVVSGVDSQIQRVIDRYDLLLLNAQSSSEPNHLSYVSERLRDRQEMQEVERFQGTASSADRVGPMITEFLRNGAEEIQLTFKQNTLRVSGCVNGRRICLAFLSGDDLQIVITPPRASDPERKEAAPLEFALLAA